MGLVDEEDFEAALLSEAALAEDWERPEEDEAWAGLHGVSHGDTEDTEGIVRAPVRSGFSRKDAKAQRKRAPRGE